MIIQTVEELNERANAVGYEVKSSEQIGFALSVGGGPWCRVYKNGEPCHKFSWRAEEVQSWLIFREKDAE